MRHPSRGSVHGPMAAASPGATSEMAFLPIGQLNDDDTDTLSRFLFVAPGGGLIASARGIHLPGKAF